MNGGVYCTKSGLQESNDVKPSDDELGFLSCREIVDYCLDFLSGSLPQTERQLFSSHLRNCPDCMRFFETYRKTPEVSREALALRMPDRVRVAVRDFLRTRYEGSPATDDSSSRR
jgi:anti-sigma factor RsiW